MWLLFLLQALAVMLVMTLTLSPSPLLSQAPHSAPLKPSFKNSHGHTPCQLVVWVEYPQPAPKHSDSHADHDFVPATVAMLGMGGCPEC